MEGREAEKVDDKVNEYGEKEEKNPLVNRNSIALI